MEESKITEEQIAKVFQNEGSKKKAERILNDASKAEEFVRKINKALEKVPIVGDYFADVPTLCLMVMDYAKGEYKDIPLATMIGIVVALLYFLSPIDLIPDVLPFVGKLDDAAVIGFAVTAAHNDIADYKEWKGL